MTSARSVVLMEPSRSNERRRRRSANRVCEARETGTGAFSRRHIGSAFTTPRRAVRETAPRIELARRAPRMRTMTRCALALAGSWLVACASAPAASRPEPHAQPAPTAPLASAPKTPESAPAKREPIEELRAVLDEIRSSVDGLERGDRGARIEDADAQIRRARVLLALRGEYGAMDERMELDTLESRFQICAIRELQSRADAFAATHPDDFGGQARVYAQVEEWISDAAAKLFKSGHAGTEEAHRRKLEVIDKGSFATVVWADSPTQGFAVVLPRNLLEPREFAVQPDEEKPHWQASPLASYAIESGALVVSAREKPGEANKKFVRAGVLFWSPDAKT